MSYNDAQLQATQTFIIKFFIQNSKPPVDILTQFQKHISTTLEQIKIYNPDNFTLKRTNFTERYLIEWIDLNILFFPEDFSVTLTKEGNSFATLGREKIIIFQDAADITPKTTPDSTSLSNPRSISKFDSRTDSRSESRSSSGSGFKAMSLCSLTPVTLPYMKKEPTRQHLLTLSDNQIPDENRVYEQPDYDALKQDLLDLEKQVACLSLENYTRNPRAKKSLVSLQGERKNNLYGMGDKPKYVSGASGAMYIPLYIKNKYGFPYVQSSQINKKMQHNQKTTYYPPQGEDHPCIFKPDW